MGFNTGVWEKVDYTQNNVAIDFYLSKKLNSVILANDASTGDTTLTLESGHGVTTNDYLEFWEEFAFMQVDVTAVDGDTITIDTPLDYGYTTNAVAKRVNIDLNVDGSSTERGFSFQVYNGVTSHLVALAGLMSHSGEGDDGKFGDIVDGLTNSNSIYVGSERKVNKLNKTTHLWTDIRTNGDLRLRSSRFEYSAKGAGGAYATFFDRNFENTNMSHIHLIGKQLDRIFIKVRDNLSTLNKFRVMYKGNIFLK